MVPKGKVWNPVTDVCRTYSSDCENRLPYASPVIVLPVLPTSIEPEDTTTLGS